MFLNASKNLDASPDLPHDEKADGQRPSAVSKHAGPLCSRAAVAMTAPEMGPIKVRPGRPGDAAAVARIHVETWRATYAGLVPDAYLVRMTEAGQAFQWERALSRARGLEDVLVAEAAGTGVVGFGSCGRNRSRQLPFAGEVFTLYVTGDFQNRGIGRRLLAALFARCVERGMTDALIWVLSGNPSRFFYEAMGGLPVGRQEEPFAGAMLQETAYGWPDLRQSLAGGALVRKETP
jgi:ribosomal protein S18 acetylase RimI-like enzyme